ncbi:uncharacterized protein LOC112502221 isoform X1 [Cynara cardunculus var. scolymus]|uniref:uncharacterized protein LOC112502221 isoform X1 n=1 Tax=Cynara cardunculus var. scolymus TaxID=59895 RepID=UPI000D6292CF|nr:uncharacterized protein LOC112502221 isoform X1 [Cynara cardunculus var. scolymus]
MDIDPPAPPSSKPKKLKFNPKPPPRRKTGPLLPKSKSDSSDEDAEAAREFVREVNQRLCGTRGPKVEKKSSGDGAMSLGDGSSTTQLRTHGQPKDRNTKNSLNLRESAEKSIMLTSSAATKDGDLDENPSLSSSADGFESSSKTRKEYKEPFDSKYHPISLPWRRPGSGNPELLNAQEFGQEEEYDENKINSALELGLLCGQENSEEKQFILFQFPSQFPLNEQPKGKDDKKVKNPDLKELPDGFMGKMLVYESGAIKFKLGDTTFDVSSGTPRECAQDVAIMNTKSKDCCVLGAVQKQAIVTPDLSSVLTNINQQ